MMRQMDKRLFGGQMKKKANFALWLAAVMLFAHSCADRGPKATSEPRAGDGPHEVKPMKEKNPLEDQLIASAVFFPRPDMPFGAPAEGARDHMFEVE